MDQFEALAGTMHEDLLLDTAKALMPPKVCNWILARRWVLHLRGCVRAQKLAGSRNTQLTVFNGQCPRHAWLMLLQVCSLLMQASVTAAADKALSDSDRRQQVWAVRIGWAAGGVAEKHAPCRRSI